LITVLLGVVFGVGVGAGGEAGVGAGTFFAAVEVEVPPPHDTSINMAAKIKKNEVVQGRNAASFRAWSG
jgi:hypothetical protein